MKQTKKVWSFVLGMLILFSMSANAQITFTKPGDIAYVDDAIVGENIIRSQNGTCFLRVENLTYRRNNPNFTIYYSKNGDNWRLLIDEVTRYNAQFDLTKAMFMDAYIGGIQLQLVETEDGYIALPGQASNEIWWQNKKVYILDKNLQAQFTMFEDSAIGSISYVDGMYYLERYVESFGKRPPVPSKSEYLCSATLEPDLDNWIKCDGMPIVNDGHIVYVKGEVAMKGYWSQELTGVVSLYSDGQARQEIVYEDCKIYNIRTGGGYFVGLLSKEGDGTKVKAAFSKDGVYFIT